MGNELASTGVTDFEIAWLGQSPEGRRLCAPQSLNSNLSDSSDPALQLNDSFGQTSNELLWFWGIEMHVVLSPLKLPRPVSVVAVVFFLCAGVLSQRNTEYGDWRELAGVKTIFLDVGVDADLRRTISAEVRKRLPALTIV